MAAVADDPDFESVIIVARAARPAALGHIGV
jgi:hypothetical protein